MKVQGFNAVGGEMIKKLTAEEVHESENRNVVFSRKLSEASAGAHERHIADSIDKIYEQGKRLSEKADLKELHIYKEMIKELVSETVSNAYEFTKSSQFGGRGRNKVYAIINKVDEKLDEMTQMVLNKEKDNIELLSMVDDIKGMLVDMLL